MPNESIWLPKEHTEHLDTIIEDVSSIENRSQAIQFLVRNDKQRTYSP